MTAWVLLLSGVVLVPALAETPPAPTPVGGQEGSAPLLDLPPEVLRPRSPALGLALGGVIGFGSGYYYAGEATRGLVYTVIDGVLVGALMGTTVALNQLVIEHDFRSGKSLARGERDFGRREANLYVISVGLAALLVGSHGLQAWGSFTAAGRTNEVLGKRN